MAETTARGRLVHTGAIVRTVVATLALGIALFTAANAQAAYQQAAEHFGVGGEAERLAKISVEAEQLDKTSAIAVNVNGVGLPAGEAGSFYVGGWNGRVARYGSGREGEAPPFREAWGWNISASEPKEAFQRCGPAVEEETGKEAHCKPGNKDGGGAGGEEPGHFTYTAGVAVDQATGDVYVLNTSVKVSGEHREHHLIEVFTATGSPVGEGFGDHGRDGPAPAESIAEGPEKLHEVHFPENDGLAVDETGKVYVTDEDFFNIASTPESRVTCFEPEHPGEYDHYRYCGPGQEITEANSLSREFTQIVLAGAGRLVVASRGLIREYQLGAGSTPLCTFKITGGSVYGVAANPETGEVFFSDGEEVHHLGPCNIATGSFAQVQQAIRPEPLLETIGPLALNPTLAWSARYPSGVLYGTDYGSKTFSNLGDVFIPAEVHPPVVESESVSNVGSSVATFGAEVDPEGSNTRFVFQYVTGADYEAAEALAEAEGKSGAQAEDAAFAGASEAPVGGSFLGSGNSGVAASATASGLLPETEYRVRVLATSHCNPENEANVCEDVGSSVSVLTFPLESPGLPDGRAYELVSPVEKHGGEVFPADDNTYSCTYPCKPPGGGITVVFPMQSAPDGEAVAYMGFPFSASEGAAAFDSYVSRRTPSGWQTTVMSPSSQPTKQTLGTVAYGAGLEQGLISQTSPSLSPEAPAGYIDLYLQSAAEPSVFSPLLKTAPPNRGEGAGFALEYAGHSGDFKRQFFAASDSLTGATADAPQPPDPGFAGRDLYEWHEGKLALVNVAPGDASVVAGASFASKSPDTHAISDDGSRVFFQSGSTVYVRENGQETIEVNHPGTFLTASADGARVLLADGCLYELASETCVDLTEGQGGFQGISGQSEDLSRVYFVDTAVLPEDEENELGENALAGRSNLYLWEEGAPTRFITTLGSEDNRDWLANPGFYQRTAEASGNGQWLAFQSKASLTGYDNFGSTCARNASTFLPGNCFEVFLYHAAGDEHLACVSCSPAGEAPRGSSTLGSIADAQEWVPQPRYLTDQGRLFFDSQERLSTLDSNGGVEDVYESEPNTVGSCRRASGCLSLISPGTGSVDSNFLAMDENGKNVFFTTRERLVSADRDELIDLYDAREGGGFPGQAEAGQSECQGEACQSPPAPPVFTGPGSAFAGTGNLVSPLPAAGAPKPKSKAGAKTSTLTKSLKACRKKRVKRERVACERQARKRARDARNSRHTTKHGVKR